MKKKKVGWSRQNRRTNEKDHRSNPELKSPGVRKECARKPREDGEVKGRKQREGEKTNAQGERKRDKTNER